MHRSIPLTVILALPAVVCAQQPDLSNLDQNQDSFLSFGEASRDGNLAAQFNALDANRDGFLSPAEQVPFTSAATGGASTGATGAQPDFNFSNLDQDGNGFLTPGEAALDPTLAPQFTGIDVNQDGLVSLNELRGFTAGAPGTTQPQSPGIAGQPPAGFSGSGAAPTDSFGTAPPRTTAPDAIGDGISGQPPSGFSGSPPAGFTGSPPTGFTGPAPGTPTPSPITPAPNPVAPTPPGTVSPGAGGSGGTTGP